MGGEQSKAERSEKIKHTSQYLLDARLIEKFTSLPSYFSSAIQKSIEEIQQLKSKIPPHPFEQYLIHAIDQRFSKLNKVNMQAVAAGKAPIEVLSSDLSKFTHPNWFQLQNKQRFLKILKHFQYQYHIQLIIQEEYTQLQKQNTIQKGKFQSLRKPMKVQQEETKQMDQGLIMRLFFHYYLVIIKTYANSGEKHITRFHEETGKQLCLIIIHNYLNLEELYQLFYYMVYIDKHPTEIKHKLSIINHLYHYKCLKTQYSINITDKKLKALQATARLYLDELYLNSIREAEDPEIKNTDDTLMPIKVFPISRVKDKPRS